MFIVVDIDDPFERLAVYGTKRGLQFHFQRAGFDTVLVEVTPSQVKFLCDEMNKYLASPYVG